MQGSKTHAFCILSPLWTALHVSWLALWTEKEKDCSLSLPGIFESLEDSLNEPHAQVEAGRSADQAATKQMVAGLADKVNSNMDSANRSMNSAMAKQQADIDARLEAVKKHTTAELNALRKLLPAH